MWTMFLWIAGLAALDQVIKMMVMQMQNPIWLWDEVIKIDVVWNHGLSWGVCPTLCDGDLFYAMIVFWVAGTFFISRWAAYAYKKKNRLEAWSLLFAAAGGWSNTIDRLYHRAVCDFVHIYFPHYIFPAFNVADVYLTLGFVMIVVSLYRKK